MLSFITFSVAENILNSFHFSLIYYEYIMDDMGFTGGLVVKNLPANAGDDPWDGKIWRRAWQPIPVFLPGESHGQRSLWATVHRVTKSQT